MSRNYKLKNNIKRFFMPNEWERFIEKVPKRNRIIYEFLFQTGMRYNEAKNVNPSKEIDFKNRQIIVTKAKGGRVRTRLVHLTKEYSKELETYFKANKMFQDQTLGFPTLQGAIKGLKKACKEAGILDFQDFSMHNIRKTHENYLIALGKNIMLITAHMGHNMKISSEHYHSGIIIKDPEQKTKIEKWFGSMFE